MSNRLALRRREVRRPRQGAQLQTTLFRALAVVRAVVLCYAIALTVTRRHEFAHPGLAWLVLGGMVLWSGLATWAYDSPRRRQLLWLAIDLAMAVAALASTPYVESAAMLHGSAATVPSYWVIAAVLAWSLRYGWVPGVAAAVLVCLVDLSVRVVRDATTWGNIFLILLAAGVVGYAAEMVRTASEERARAERSAAALAEPVRLARAVHDGVLQVLALVQRRAPSWAARQPNSAGWPASRNSRCERWCRPRPIRCAGRPTAPVATASGPRAREPRTTTRVPARPPTWRRGLPRWPRRR